MILCYTPTLKFSRLYFSVKTEENKKDIDKNDVWKMIKKDCYGIDEGENTLAYWSDSDEEKTEMNQWLCDWDNPKAWDVHTTMAMDNHY